MIFRPVSVLASFVLSFFLSTALEIVDPITFAGKCRHRFIGNTLHVTQQQQQQTAETKEVVSYERLLHWYIFYLLLSSRLIVKSRRLVV